MTDVNHPKTFLEDLRRRARRWTQLDEDENEPPRPTTEHANRADDDSICRICFSGREEEPSLGRLFSPCLCRGTISKVHMQCLEDWRRQSVGQRSFFQCDQCHYRYRIGRTKLAGLLTRPPTLVGLTAALLFALAFVAGNLSFLVLQATDLLPSTPLFHDLYWFFGQTPYGSSPLMWGSVLHEGVEESLNVFTLPLWLASGPIGWIIGRMSLGAAVLGFLSFIQLVASWALLGHLHHLGLFRRRGQARDAGGGRPGQRSDLFALVVIGVVLFGLARAFMGLYRLVQRGAKFILTRLGERVLEVR